MAKPLYLHGLQVSSRNRCRRGSRFEWAVTAV